MPAQESGSQEPGETSCSPMPWTILLLPWLGLALVLVLVLKLLAVLVGSPQVGPQVLLSTLAFTIHDHGPMTLLGLLMSTMALQMGVSSLPGRAMAWRQRLTRPLTAGCAILLAVLLLGSTIIAEVELQQDRAQQQTAAAQEIVRLQEQLEEIRSAPFLDQLANPGRLEELRASLPGMASPEADAQDVVAILEQLVLRDLNQLQESQQNPSAEQLRESWGARLFRQLPEVVMAAAAAIMAGVVVAGHGKPLLQSQGEHH